MKYPIGIQDFRKLREGGYVYVDKTERIYRLLQSGNYYFLSRPRRFGKSLLLSTMNELYSGSRELFEGLWIENHWNWEQTNPVIWLKFSSQGVRTLGLVPAIQRMLSEIAASMDIELQEESYDLKFKELIVKAAAKEKAVLLIDEYDKPIIDYLDDVPEAEANREILKNFYSVLKDSDPYLELVFITGVSAFSRVSIFSDLNNLKNLSLHKDASELLGISSYELETYFYSSIQQIATRQKVNPEELYKKIRRWYNGYSWDGVTKLYNPFSLLNFLDGEKFHNFWFATGTPIFLVKEMRKQRYYDIDQVEVSESQLSAFDFQNLDPITVLFQTGYLTIDAYDQRFRTYLLKYPNEEVRFSLQQYLLNAYRGTLSGNALAPAIAITKALESKDVERAIEAINTTFSSIPYDLWQKENEHFYHALIHLMFSLLGTYIQSEVHTSKGRCDALVQTDNHIYVFEFKLDKTAGEALQQIKEKGYLAPYQNSPKQKVAIGVNFSTTEKKVVEWLVEER